MSSMNYFIDPLGRLEECNGFTPSTDLMDEDIFWDIISKSFNKADGSLDRQQTELRELLKKRSVQDLILFQNRYLQLRGQAYSWSLWGAAYIIMHGCSDDSFCYFRDWMISRGPVVYKNTLADPEWLLILDLETDETDAETIAYVAGKVFEERTGARVFPAEFVENHEISGTRWQENGDDLAEMFPKLWKKYNDAEQ